MRQCRAESWALAWTTKLGLQKHSSPRSLRATVHLAAASLRYGSRACCRKDEDVALDPGHDLLGRGGTVGPCDSVYMICRVASTEGGRDASRVTAGESAGVPGRFHCLVSVRFSWVCGMKTRD